MWWQVWIPNPILFNFASLSIRWYGLILVIAIVLASLYAGHFLIKKKVLSSRQVDDLFFYVIIFGLLGARFGHVVFFELGSYLQYPIDIFKIWHGGISIQGALLGGIVTIILWARHNKINFWKLVDVMVPAVALGQFIGRWGNYFNQELFGKPTDSWWGIPIAAINRVEAYQYFTHFQPAFFFESILNLVLFIILHFAFKISKLKAGIITLSYFIGYSIIRFFMEFIRIDETFILWGFRLPQLISLVVIIVAIALIFMMVFKPLPKSKK